MIDHIALVVKDPEVTAAYLQTLGYEVKRRTPHHGGSAEVVSKDQPELVLEICTCRPQDKTGVDHICFGIGSEKEFEELQAKGLTIDAPLHFSKDSGRMITNHKDSDGIKWQFTV